MKKHYLIGIDPGTKTGFAIWNAKAQEFTQVETRNIVSAMQQIRFIVNDKVVVFFEDARLRKFFGNSGRERLQGAGSIKRDSAIWEEFCKYYDIEYQAVAPKNNITKTKADYFKKLTGWDGRTSEHSRDAGMLVFGRPRWNTAE